MRLHVVFVAVAFLAASYLATARAADVYWDINGSGAPAFGDYNNDGKVDADDYVIWRKFNGTNTPLPNDNGLGTPIGLAQYNLWRSNYGNVNGGAGGATPNGNWDSTTPNWSTSSAGSTATQVWNPAGTDVAVFSAGSDATGSYTATIDAQTASGVRVEDGNVTIATGTLTLNSGSSINVLSGHTATISATLSNNSGDTLSKDGTGALVLASGNNLNGTTTLNSGTIGVGNAGSFGSTAGSSTLNINGGTLSNSNPSPTAPIVNVSANLNTNINANFTVDNSQGTGSLLSFNSSAAAIIAGGGKQTLTGNRTITVNGPPSAGSAGTELKGLALNNVVESGGSFGITKTGTGTLRFEEPSGFLDTTSFTGDVTVQQGVLEVSTTGWIGGKVSTNGGGRGGNTINMAGGSFNLMGGGRNTANPINNPFVITAPTTISGMVDSSFTGTMNENFFGIFSTPNNSKITFSNLNMGVVGSGTANSSCPNNTICTLYNPRWTGTASYTYSGDIEIDNSPTVANELTRFSNFNPNAGSYGTGSTITLSGVISGNGQFSRSATSAGGTGGNTVFTGANTMTGLVAVVDGILYVNNTSGSGTGTASVNVGSFDATSFWNNCFGFLSGNGSMTSPITVWRSGFLKPGTAASPIATLTGGSLTFTDANNGSTPGTTAPPASDPATYAFDFDSSHALGAGSADLMNVNGNLSFSAGGTLGGTAFAALALNDLAASPVALANGTKYTLIDYSGTWDGGTFAGLSDGGTVSTPNNTFTIHYADATPGVNGGSLGKYVTITRTGAGAGSLAGGTTVPEPASAVLLVIGVAGLCGRRRNA